MKLLSYIGLALAACTMLAANTYASEAPHNKGKSSTKSTKKAAQASKEDEPEPDVQLSKSFEYKCELGNSLTMYTNADDQEHVAMRWQKHLYKMTKVDTTTGAVRFENTKAGFVWIGIPAKGLLLDSHKGQQLANECKTDTPALAEVDNKPAEATEAK